MLGDPSIDAVVVASPTPTHVDLLTRAVRTGKAVLCEKPIDLDITRVDACRAAIGALADRVMLGFNRRFDPSFADIRARVQAGEIGTLEQLTIISRDPAPPPAGYVTTSGGLFRDMTIHDFDMARFFLGDVVEVGATGSNLVSSEIAEAGDIDGAVVVLRGAGGALCSITNSRRCAFGYDQRLEAFGERGMLERGQPAADQRPVLGCRPAPRSRRPTTTSSSTGTHRPTGRSWTLRHRHRAGRHLLARLRRRPRGPRAGRRREREPADRHRGEGGALRTGCQNRPVVAIAAPTMPALFCSTAGTTGVATLT